MEESVIYNSVSVFRFAYEYEISTELGLAVSDHWPVEVQLKGGTSQKAKANLTPNLCLTVEDARKKSLPSQFKTQKTALGFTIETTETSSEIYASSTYSDELLQSFQKFQSKYQQLVSSEVVDTIVYKVTNGALGDPTSNDDLEERLSSILISFDGIEQKTTVHYCVATTIN